MTVIEMSITLSTLVVLEIILGIDNLIFLTVLTEKLPVSERQRARYWGLSFAWIARLLLLACAAVLVKLNTPLFVIHDISFSVHTLFLAIGGLFLITKAIQEIHYEMMPQPRQKRAAKTRYAFWEIVLQIVMMDLVFSIDTVMTAIGLTNEFWMMAVAISIAILGMLYLSSAITQFMRAYPTFKMLALAFLLLIGTFLVADGFSFHIPREYLYVVVLFSLGIECLNMFKSKQRRGSIRPK